jgi:hypothetical protein
MLKKWHTLLTGDCLVITIGNRTVFPIFRNGSTSLIASKEQSYSNQEIANCHNIQILIRDPIERFSSGVNEYSRQHGVGVDQVINSVLTDDLVDKHFAPQHIWLLHLYKFYKGTVTLRPWTDIVTFTSLHRVAKDYRTGDFKKKEITTHPEMFIKPDSRFGKWFGTETLLGDILKDSKDVLS